MQRRLSQKLIFKDTLPETINYVAGVDVAYLEGVSFAVAVVLDCSTLSVVEFQTAHVKTRFPYVPTLLSFREIPPAYSATKRLHIEPDVFLVDGQGYAHPYGLGFASHLGLLVDKPTVGVAKSLLWGKTEHKVENERVSFLKHNGDVVGAEVVTKLGTKPVYVSVGHKMSLARATELVMNCTGKYRLPEPIRRAHMIANEEKKRIRSVF
jgi:deoxyribonuclease V